MGEAIISDALEFLSEKVDISSFDGCTAVFAVFNTYSNVRNSLVTCEVDLDRRCV